ncbi:DUF1292 domain-containing protein [Clostridium tarantellae]|uniref:DUF1292 domain-containing protein n=1 Tax=Clostridium tarantellae TaxID=39493 RepID=A0A6I1MI88_9CLOT|nr:DUF1292 domain-containing protein [Clostridium tarantellae]MPQ43276.1 DUF1292 domain-containing protein [Clostridium tarantellae]
MEEKQIMAFKDEEGNKVEFEVIAKIYLNEDTEDEKEYIILSPVEGKEDDAFIFRIDNINEKIEYNLVENDEEFNEVKKQYKSLLY